MKRKIIKIDETRCNGCGDCIPNCPEGALQVIDGKARLVSDLFCDGLGACLGHCPQGAISVHEREAVPYDERKVMENIIREGEGTIRAHLKHLREHGETVYREEAISFLKERKIAVPDDRDSPVPDATPCSCPGAAVRQCTVPRRAESAVPGGAGPSELRQWPIQLMLVPPHAPYLREADILIAADCVPFAYPDFHRDLLKGRALLVACPKLDDLEPYRQKLKTICAESAVASITYAHMAVPCCAGLIPLIKEAIAHSGRAIPFHDVTVDIQGGRLS